MYGCAFQIMPDKIGGDKSYLEKQEKYLNLRERLPSARCTEVPGKEEGTAKRNECRNAPPDFLVPAAFCFGNIF